MKEPFKDVTVGEERYRVGRMSPEVGAWIGNLLLTSIMRSQAGSGSGSEESAVKPASPEELIEGMWMASADIVSEQNYSRIQRHCLALCSQYVGGSEAPIPIVMRDGRFSAKDIDAAAVSRLVVAALQFNLASFFAQGQPAAT